MFGADLTIEHVEWMMGEGIQDKSPASLAYVAATREEKYMGMKTYIVVLRDPILPVPWQKLERAGLKKEKLIKIDTLHEPFVNYPKILAVVLR